MLILLAPLTIFVLGIYMGIIFILYAILNLFVRLFWIIAFSLLVAWVYKGRPSADDFVQGTINDVAGVLKRVQRWFGRLVLSRRESDEERPDERGIVEDGKEKPSNS